MDNLAFMSFFAEAGRKNQVAGFLLLLIYFLLILQMFIFKIYFKKPKTNKTETANNRVM